MKPLFLLFTLLAVVPQVFSQTKNPECRIVAMNSDAGENTRFSYDDSGRVKTISQSGNYVTHFDYYNNIILATETRNDSITNKRILTIGSNDMMSTLFEESYNDGMPKWNYTSYIYNGRELKGTTTITSNSSIPEQSILAWKKGNFVSEKVSDNSGEVKFEYYPDKTVQSGDYWYINLLATMGTGDKLYQNKNLVKGIRSNNSVANISYQFDESGKIISMTKTAENTDKIWKYEYECK